MADKTSGFTLLEYCVLLYSIVYGYILYSTCNNKSKTLNIIALILTIVATLAMILGAQIKGGQPDWAKFIEMGMAFTACMLIYTDCVHGTKVNTDSSNNDSSMARAVRTMFPALITVVGIMVLVYLGQYFNLDDQFNFSVRKSGGIYY